MAAHLHSRFIALENVLHRLLIRHSISALRISVGVIFLGFGVLKYFPGVSPAEMLATETTHVLFLGLIPSSVAIYIVATMECFIGLCFLIGSGGLMRVAIWVLVAQFVGILSPLVIEPGQLFAGPHHAPTLEGQYVLKDILLVTAGMVIAAGAFRGGRLVREEPEDDPSIAPHPQGISESTFYEWRELTLPALPLEAHAPVLQCPRASRRSASSSNGPALSPRQPSSSIQ